MVIVDISGSIHTYRNNVCTAVNMLKNALNDDDLMSVFTSNHRLVQLYHHNCPSHIPDLTFDFNGLSALYDNVYDVLTHQSTYNETTSCNAIIVTDNDDNYSVMCSKIEHDASIDNLSRTGMVHIVHPRDAVNIIMSIIN
jgi:hypothetical protein